MVLGGIVEASSVLGLGLLLGVKHAFEADHVIAISTIASKHKSFKATSRIGAFWGLGHTATLLVIGIMVLLLRVSIPDKVAVAFEFAVGIMLTMLGASVLYNAIKNWNHSHNHKHEGMEHAHAHSLAHHYTRKSFFIGMVHGLAGSAALMLLVLASIDSIVLGVIYIVLFGIGSVASMTIVSAAISAPFIFTAKRFDYANKIIKVVAGSVSILLGISIMVVTGQLLI